MSRPSAFDTSPEWVTATQAKRVIGCVAQSALMRLVVLGQLRVRNEPGLNPRYNLEDCHRIAQARRGNLQRAGG